MNFVFARGRIAQGQQARQLQGADAFLQEILPAIFAAALELISCVAGVAVGVTSYWLLHRGAPLPSSPQTLLVFAFLYWLTYMALGASHGRYLIRSSLLRIKDSEAILRASFYCLIVLNAECFIMHVSLPRICLITGWPTAVLLMLLVQPMVRRAMASARRPTQKTLIVGVSRESRRLFSFLLDSQQVSRDGVIFVSTSNEPTPKHIFSHDYRHTCSAPVIEGGLEAALQNGNDVAQVFIADRSLTGASLNNVMAFARENGAELFMLGGITPLHPTSTNVIHDYDGLPVISFRHAESRQPCYFALKRVFDVVFSLVVISLLSPIMATCAILVFISSSGPVLFRQQRVGQHGNLFTILKFRSMHVNAPVYCRSPEESNDARITPIGRFLRKTSLDELPQLFNVLRGEMSIVGPRPEMPFIVSSYSEIERMRLQVPQGLTGIWQLSADRKFSIHQTIEYDLYYVENRSFFLDMALLLHTFVFAMKGI